MQLIRWRNRLIGRTVLLFTLFITLVFNPQSLIFAEQDSPKHPADPLIIYQEQSNLLEADNSMAITLYQDGYIHVYYPQYMIHAGSYRTYLNDHIVNEIWRSITKELLEFDEKRVHQHILLEKKARKEAFLTLSTASDHSRISIEIYPNRYQSRGYGNGNYDESKKIIWRGLEWDAKNYPENGMLQSLQALQDLLLSVASREHLEHLEKPD